ncbi:substrate-binding and vWA domain-containing protein [Peterkaempfera griseoplana]|uniref:substrate-binding and vWA domain-containing protein n=1 Tax=Peterkaempfera griseoplana TaxID=66896 RepID=UPI0006E3278F|nr:VWA domain-containing protein [Peterkaempfera griseoplana]
MRTVPRIAAAAALAGLLLTGCTGGGSGGGSGDGQGGQRTARPQPGTLRVLAGSELSDLEPVLKAAEKATGVKVVPTYSGTLDAVQQIASGQADRSYDAVWLPSDDYLRLHPEAARRIGSETPVMTSPVALGVRPEAVRRLGWDPGKVTWAQIGQAVTEGRLTYGMTDPARSNSGYSALVGLASALSGAQSALTEQDVRHAAPALKRFFAGQKLTSGSSGWLAQAYARQGSVDALINYESVLLSLNRDSHTDLTVIRPVDGVVTADYPLTLLASAGTDQRTAYTALTRYLRSPGAQQAITRQTLRRPVVASVAPDPRLPAGRRRELPFPGSRAVADGLLDSYENQLRRPSRTVYVLDTSGSMDGSRLSRLKTALAGLTGTDAAPGERFRDREEVTLMPFADTVKGVLGHTVEEGRRQQALDAIRADADALRADGGTAIYSSLQEAYRYLGQRADEAGGDRFTSIVLMTDGENTAGESADDFNAFYAALPADQRSVPVFPILFGDSDRAELQHIADLTGGRLFDAVGSSLSGAFEEIRGYQ